MHTQRTIPRSEHPRPQFQREHWCSLNGVWQFEIDQSLSGEDQCFYNRESFNDRIIVPFCPESKLSGLAYTDFMNAVWYQRDFWLSDDWLRNRRVLLHIDACDYETKVYINRKCVGVHRGGYCGFTFDITQYVRVGSNVICVYAKDDVRSPLVPRGKQSELYASHGCDYTRTTGIWQSVWLESTPIAYIESAQYDGDIQNGTIYVRANCQYGDKKHFTVNAFYDGRCVGTAGATVCGNYVSVTVPLSEIHLWNVGKPELYELELILEEDRVCSYFGLRSLAYVNGVLEINGKPIFQRLVLDQGYYPDGIYTAPSDDELKADITRSLACGFNGARLHQKVFEPRFLYHCDRMGYIVWGEYGSWGIDYNNDSAWLSFIDEWMEVLKRDYNHPAIIGWCPLNETTSQQNERALRMVYDVTKLYDAIRPVIDTSGYNHVPESFTDVVDVHYYEQDAEKFKSFIKKVERGRPVRIPLNHNGAKGVITFISEYGGIWWSATDTEGFGYGTRPASETEFIERYRRLTEAMLESPAISAFCYTQLTDIEQERNGLYTYDRKPKFDVEIFRKINSQKAAVEDNA